MHRWIPLVALVALPLASGQNSRAAPDPAVEILVKLHSLPVAIEVDCDRRGVDSDTWAGMHDQIAELHRGLLSPYNGVVFPNFDYVQIEHIVARKEADQSGLCDKGLEARMAFAADEINLTFAPGALNASKGDRDVHDIVSAKTSLFRDSLTSHGMCWWAAQTVRVKEKHGLRVDQEEWAALLKILLGCEVDQLERPKLPSRANWAFREEFLDALAVDDDVQQCGGEEADPARLATAASIASPWVAEMACRPFVIPSERLAESTVPGSGDDQETVIGSHGSAEGSGKMAGEDLSDP